MRMAARLLGLALLASSTWTGAADANEIWRRNSGQWTVKLVQTPGQRAWCSWDTRFPSSGRTVSFMLNNTGLHLFLAAPNMRLDRLRGQQAMIRVGQVNYPVTFGFGDFNARTNLGGAAGPIASDPTEMRNFVVAFAGASTASIRFATGVAWDFGLRGTAASLPHMAACTAEMRQRNGGGGVDLDPTRGAPSPRSLDPTVPQGAPQPAPRGLPKQ
ncbi:hypothetical protein [Falsiroseomonas tokyonensis]|uniref:Uncharacterized protein n=1 Tax=Falsiroseomonas tokyonensis TaxID=430521 RepID=A0ABV7BSY8_9PROT|nr:hypothetical protein [Falsiroseomonas tokyonensis]MBU8538147.1 hypothetical protein [Falsiroseomonas tokyonensis]